MTENVDLRAMLIRDFGVDLPISGGGGKKGAPIIISTQTLQEAVDVQMSVHRCIGKGREIAWRLEDSAVVDPAQKLVRAGLETLVFTDDQVTTNGEGLYFVLEALPGDSTSVDLPVPRGFRDPESGLQLPYQLGWLHLDSVTDYESQASGLGCSAAYGGLGINATVYVYPWDAPPSSNSVEAEAVQAHFEQAVRDALKMNPGARITYRGTVPDRKGEARMLTASLELESPKMSYVMLTGWHGYFVKVRVTCATAEKKINQTMGETVGALMDAIYSEPAKLT